MSFWLETLKLLIPGFLSIIHGSEEFFTIPYDFLTLLHDRL